MRKLLITKSTRIEEINCMLMGRFGFSYANIAKRTGLTRGQIAIILRRFGIKVTDYRNGVTVLAQRVADATTRESSRYLHELKDELRGQLLEINKEANEKPS